MDSNSLGNLLCSNSKWLDNSETMEKRLGRFRMFMIELMHMMLQTSQTSALLVLRDTCINLSERCKVSVSKHMCVISTFCCVRSSTSRRFGKRINISDRTCGRCLVTHPFYLTFHLSCLLPPPAFLSTSLFPPFKGWAHSHVYLASCCWPKMGFNQWHHLPLFSCLVDWWGPHRLPSLPITWGDSSCYGDKMRPAIFSKIGTFSKNLRVKYRLKESIL